MLASEGRSWPQWANWLCREEGQDFAEYALIFAMVVLIAVVAFSPLGSNLGGHISATLTAIVAQL